MDLLKIRSSSSSPWEAITVIKGDKGDPGSGGAYTWDEISDKPFTSIGNNLLVVNGVLDVDVVETVGDYTKPITAAAVYTEIGNISALLETI